MERFKIEKIEEQKESGEKWISVLIKDNKEKISFWIDCSLIDGYGNHKDFKTEDLYVDWSFNQYIFHLDYEEDIKAQNYQNNGDNIDYLQEFIDENNDYLVNILRKEA